jgi:Adenine-specific DNA methylase containing a Zn-ribbon
MDPLSEGGEGHVAYADAVSVYLALAISRWADLSNSLVSWNSTNENARALFSRQAFPMGWDYCEVNPFSSAIGVSLAFDNVATSLDALPASGIASVRQADAAGLPEPQERVLVSTDPPYYDNVPFADLSDFFYVWLRKALSDTYPSLGETLVTPKTEEIVADLVRHGGKRAARDHFEAGLTAAFQRIASVCSPEYPVTIFYAFKQTESDAGTDGGSTGDTSTGWETMLESLMAAGFVIGGTWPVRTERATRSRALDANALASSIVLVCRPRSGAAGITDRRGFVSSLKQELPEALRTLQHGNIAPVDLAQASIGPGMAVFSRHAKVLEPDGSLMRVRTALGLINQVLDEILAEQEGEFDADTRWAIAWYEQVGLGEAAYGIAETLSKAKDTSIAGLVEAGIVAAGKGKVRLLSRAEYSADWDPAKDDRIPVWEATQRLIHALLDDGEAAAASLLVRLGGVGDTARDLAYRMYHVAERKGWTDEARAYNALVVAWMDFASGGELAQPAEPTQASLGLE